MSQLIRFVIILSLALMLLPHTPAAADSAYFYRWDAVSNVVCELTSIKYDYTWTRNFPAAGGEVSWQWQVNDILDSGPSFVPMTGTGSVSLSDMRFHNDAPDSFPYTAKLIDRSYMDGQLLYQSSLIFTCPGPGAGSAIIENVDFSGESSVSVMGPDMITLPPGSVVGTFTITTPLYFAPENGAEADEVIEMGKSLWVTKLDPTGQFYQVALSGQFLWVPVGTIGPTYDDVWYGTPLPTLNIE